MKAGIPGERNIPMEQTSESRNRTIIRCNKAGILLNFILSAAKLAIGFLIGSRAVVLDAVNGFSDMISSLISIISTVYAEKRTDREHPLGYGRLEYVSSMFTTVFIVFMGLHAIYGSVKEILHPDGAPDYNTAVIVLMIISLVAKVIYGIINRREGKRINAVALIMSGTEAIGDSGVSAAILVTILIYRATGLNLEVWLSIIISLLIVKTGLEMIRGCVNKLLGTRADPELQKSIRKLIASQRGVRNVFNLVIHNYGENVWIGSVDIEVDGDMPAAEITKLTRIIIRKTADLGVRMSSVGICGTHLSDPENAEMWDEILNILASRPEFTRASAFFRDAEEQTVSFFVVPAQPVRESREILEPLQKDLEKAFPGVTFNIDLALED